MTRVVDDGEADWERLEMPMTSLIYDGLTEQLDRRLLLFPSPEPEYLPSPLR